MKKIIKLFSFVILFSHLSFSQNKIDFGKLNPDASRELLLIKNLIGKYQVHTYFQTDNGKFESSAEITVKYALNGYGMSMLSHYWSKNHFYSELFLNYDEKTKKWVGASINTLGNRKTVEGVFRSDSLILIQKGMLFGGRQGENRMIFYNISPDSFSHSFDSYDAETDKWIYEGFGFTAYKIDGPDFENKPLGGTELNEKQVYKSLDDAFKNPLKVFRLDLSNTKLESLPDEISKFKNLHELKLDNTFITSLPESIGELNYLTILSIQHLKEQNTNLKKLPSSLSKLKNLEFANLIGLPNLDFPSAFNYLSSSLRLNNIALMNNNLKELPEEINKLKFIEMIWLGKNPDLNLKTTLEKLSRNVRLKKMGHGSNYFSYIPEEINKLNKLELLWLNKNDFNFFPDLTGLPKLNSLILSNCGIKEIPDTLRTYQSLEYLSLSGNPEINPVKLFDYLKDFSQLKTLELKNMEWVDYPEQIHKLKNLSSINLSGNNFNDKTKLMIENALPDTEVIF